MKPREQRWAEEASFFDEWVGARRLVPISPATEARYRAPPARPRFSKEFRFHLLGDLSGKRVLDLGCGSGANASLLARLGAMVVGLDVSARAIEVARQRAQANGVADRVDFRVGPIEVAELEECSFDVVWGDGILHHVIDELPTVLSRAARWARPDGLLVFAEPVNLCPPLRALRLRLPIRLQGTPNERPLEREDLARIAPYFTKLEIRPFSLLARLDRFLLGHGSYETASRPCRAAVDLLASLDAVLLDCALLFPLAATTVLYGKPAVAVRAPDRDSRSTPSART
jgi:2-polyprenyl-3-methyl-5-hydroxy-6-metoxy-1,4-benzoquinol methylase